MGSVPRVYIASFVPFYGTIMCILIVYYAILLAIAENGTVAFQTSLLISYSIPSFLFVGTLSHLFPRALTLTAYCCVLCFGLIPYAIGASIEETGSLIVLAFLFPLYLPYLMAQISFDPRKAEGENVDFAKPEVFLLYIACVCHLLWIFPLRFADHYVNGKYLSAWKDSVSTSTCHWQI